MIKYISKKIRIFFLPIFNPENKERGFGLTTLAVFAGVTALIGAVAYFGVPAWLNDTIKDTFIAVIWAIAEILYIIGSGLANISASIFDAANGANGLVNTSITTGQIFTIGWADVRDLANMLIVLGFIVVGISFALRLGEYGSKKTLVKLIVVALLINFSGLFCGLVIDASHILMNTFLSQGAGGSAADNVLSTINGASKKILSDPNNTKDYTSSVNALIPLTFLFWTFAITFFYLSFIFVARYAAVAFLYILSPMAFFCYIFPATQTMWKQWWTEFIKWAFIGVEGSFFIWVSMQVLTKSANLGSISGLFVVCIFFIVGMKMTTKSSAMGSAAVIGLAGGALGYAMGASKGLAKFGYGVTPLKTGAQAAQRGVTKAGEMLGLVAPGTSNLMRQKQQQEHESEKRAATWSQDQRKSLATGGTVTARQRNDKLEAIKQMAAKGELGGLDKPGELDAAMSYATSHGIPASVLAKGDYRAADYDEKRVAKVMTDRGVTNTQARGIVRQEQLQQLLPSMTEEQHRNIDAADITPDLLTSKAMSTKVIRSLRTAGNKQLSKLGNATGAPVGGTAANSMHAYLEKDFNDKIKDATDPLNPNYNVNEARRLTDIRNEIKNIMK